MHEICTFSDPDRKNRRRPRAQRALSNGLVFRWCSTTTVRRASWPSVPNAGASVSLVCSADFELNRTLLPTLPDHCTTGDSIYLPDVMDPQTDEIV